MQATEALVSGSLGQALFLAEGTLRILEEPDAEPRYALPNEIAWFRHKARALAFADPNGLPISVDDVRRRLSEEILLFAGLDGLLIGMDRDVSDGLRIRAICRAERVLERGQDFAQRIRERFLIPANIQEWDPAGALELAISAKADTAVACYRPLAHGIIDRLADDIAMVVSARLGSDVEAFRHRELILRSGLLAELALIESQGDRKALSALMFRRDRFPKLRASDPSGQILAAVVHRVEERIRPAAEKPLLADEAEEIVSDDNEKLVSLDPIIAAIERALAKYEKQKGKRRSGNAADVPGIQREIEWIGERLKLGQVPRAEYALLTLIDRQGQRSRGEDIVKTLTAVAVLSRLAKQYDWTARILAALDHLGVSDATSMTVRAQALRDVGRGDEALTVLEEAMRRFPDDEVAPNAYAEVLRGFGRGDEALAVLEETMRRFPHDEFAPTAYAEALRGFGRGDEALAVLEETMRRFPHNEVAPNAYAEALREFGRGDEALAVLEETMRRFPHNEFAPTAYAEALREFGRGDEALAVLEEAMRRFPHNEVAPNAYAEALREFGRGDEALAVLEETMRRFPHDEVAPTAYAEALRGFGRGDEALAVLEETMRRFPHNEVAPNAYAEALREFGRGDEALAVLEETMRRFPHNEVAPTAYAHLLIEYNRFAEAEALLSPSATRRQTRSDWIAVHILAMAWLRNKRVNEALNEFQHGIDQCKFADIRRYFVTARPLALLAARRAEEAVLQLEQLAKDRSLLRGDSTNIALFRIHALAEAGQAYVAQGIIMSAEVIDFGAAKQKRLAAVLELRYGILSGIPAKASQTEELNNDIARLEFDLVRPRLRNAVGRKVA